MHQLFEQQVDMVPDNTTDFEEKTLSYKELDRRLIRWQECLQKGSQMWGCSGVNRPTRALI